ncbi:MAG: hypothetical protein GX125_06010 [Bacteroidales bacterium]|nr:hypothetical protein [Bacteroidota bacterium]NLN99798.1 hypothetical protein [Bacteroidales bacterium]
MNAFIEYGNGRGWSLPKTELLEFASWKALPTTTQDRNAGIPVLERPSGQQPSPIPRDSRPGKTFRPLPKTAFPGFPSWKALRGGSQDQFPGIPVPARPSGNHPGPNCRDSGLRYRPETNQGLVSGIGFTKHGHSNRY